MDRPIIEKYNLFNTSMIFALYWVFWHLPLSFIDGYYHRNVVAEGLLYSLNFVFSLFVFVIFATHSDSKVIQTVLLLLVTIKQKLIP